MNCGWKITATVFHRLFKEFLEIFFPFWATVHFWQSKIWNKTYQTIYRLPAPSRRHRKNTCTTATMILFQILPWIGELHRKLFLFRYFCLSHPLLISVLKAETVDGQVKKPKSQLDIFFFLQKLNSNYAVWDLCLWMKPKVSPCILGESYSVSWPSILVAVVVFSTAFFFFH